MIEARGASQAYAASCAAIKYKPGLEQSNVTLGHGVFFCAANSEDEAYGKIMKKFVKAYPFSEGWIGHDIALNRIDNIDCIDA
jgi:hypothetical protein